MKQYRWLIVFVMLVIGGLIALAYQQILLREQTGTRLIGLTVPLSVSTFLPKDELKGESLVLLSDAYVDECNNRYTELNNLIVRLRKNGTRIRMLHSSRHGIPSKSYAESVTFNRGAPNHIIVADTSVIYEHPTIRRLPKPCLIVLKDGVVTDVLINESFDNWTEQ